MDQAKIPEDPRQRSPGAATANARRGMGIGIVGCGYWGINYVRVFEELAESRVVGVCDPNEERLSRVRQRFPTVATYADLNALLEDPGIEAVVVATPSATHYALAHQCLSSGRHVLVEKPFVMDIAQGETLITLAQQSQQTLMVGHTFLYNPSVRKMREYIAAGDCGDVYYLHATRTNLGPIRKDANALWDLIPHDLSIFSYLLGSRPIWVSAVATKLLRNNREDVGFVTLAYPNGILGQVHVSWADPDKVREVVLVGSKKRIVFNDLNTTESIRIFEKGISPSETDVDSFGEFRLLIRDGDIISPRVEASEPLKNQCAHFLECAVTGAKPLSDGENGLEVVRTLVAIDESVRRNGAPVEVRSPAGSLQRAEQVETR
jgi:predicted dehydrogenase